MVVIVMVKILEILISVVVVVVFILGGCGCRVHKMVGLAVLVY